MHQALARERSHQMGLESLGQGAKRLILATPLQDILKFRNDPLLYIVLNPLCMDGQIVAVCLVKKVHCWRDLFASQFERCHCFVIYSWMRNGVNQFQPRTPMAICGQRTHFFTGIATKTWCGHHFRRVSSETECQNSSLEVSLFGIWEKSHDQNSQIPKIHGFIHLRFFIRCLQVEQQIANLCFRSINDPVELGLTGGGGPWAHWVQLVITTSLQPNPTWVWG